MLFSELDLHEELLAGINDANFDSCMPVQEYVFERTLKGEDVYVQSQTGSGKTAAFLITIFEHFQRSTFGRNRALIVVPTRELAVQIESEAKLLGGHMGYRVGSFYGGVGYNEQFQMLDEKVEFVIGTPGRLIDLEQRRKLDFGDTTFLVIDEADRLFDMGFLPDIRKIVRRMPPREKRMTMLFSATLNSRVWQLAWEYMNDPVQIILNPENVTVKEVHQELYHVPQSEKLRLLLGLLKREDAENVLVFTNTKSEASALSQRLVYNGFESHFIIGDLPQQKRLKLIEKMKSGEFQVLVATDVAARGLHINDLPLVVNYDLPEDPEGYVHRIGRTARAGNTGKAISLACERFVFGLESIEELIGGKIPVHAYDESLLGEDLSQGRPIDVQAGRTPRRGAHGGPERAGSRRSESPGRRVESRRPARARPEPRTASGPKAGSGGAGAASSRREKVAPARQKPHASSTGSSRPRPPHKIDSPGSSRTPIKKQPASSQADPSRTLSSGEPLEARLKHYRQKYGEDFKLAETPGARAGKPDESKKKQPQPNSGLEDNAPPATPSLIRRIFGGRKNREK